MKILKIFILSSMLLLVFGAAIAQEARPADSIEPIDTGELIIMPGITDVEEAIALDEDIQPADLGVSEPNLLPDNPFYFIKNWGREIQSFFTFNAIAKAELREKFANEKLMELKKMVEKKERTLEQIEKGVENYQNEIAAVKRVTERIRESAEENEQVGTFLDKFIQQQVLHQRVLGKLENQVPSEAFEKIKEARETHLEKFSEVMTKLENRPEKIGERLEESMEAIGGSEFKEFKNLEVLKGLEEKVPEAAKGAIQQVQAKALMRLKATVEEMSSGKLEMFKTYTERIGGEKEKQMEILENLRAELKEMPEIKESLLQSRERVLEQVRERTQERNCAEIAKPASDFCQDGRIVVKKDDQGCIVSFGCVIPAEIEMSPKPELDCIALYDPVCGKNGKTYSNECWAGAAGVEIAYKGECREAECKTDSDCPQPRCGPTGTISARCIGAKARCIEGKCQIMSQTQVSP